MTASQPPLPHRPLKDLQDRLARPLLHWFSPFFRTFPYEGDCRISLVRARGAYSPVDGFFYNRIPKVANSTIITALAESSQFQSRGTSDNPKRHFLAPSSLTSEQVADISAGRVFRFLFVRNPYTRVLSAYQDKIRGAQRQLQRYSNHLTPGTDGVPSFETFVKFLDQGGLFLDAHWAPQTQLLLLPRKDFDFVGHFETLDHDLAHVRQRIWDSKTLAPPEFAGKRTNADSRLQEVYSDETRDIVARLYRDDFMQFGYDALNWGNRLSDQ